MFDNGVTGVGRNDLITRQSDGNPLSWSNLIAELKWDRFWTKRPRNASACFDRRPIFAKICGWLAQSVHFNA
jgi:hypothetical protein